MDRLSSEGRRRNMQAIGSKNTGIEMKLRRALWKAEIRGYRIHPKGLAGRPDLVFTRAKLAIFVDGCFWHGCPACYRPPISNSGFWQKKVEYHRSRDLLNSSRLNGHGWRVLRIWEHSLNRNLSGCLEAVRDALKS